MLSLARKYKLTVIYSTWVGAVTAALANPTIGQFASSLGVM